MTNAVKSNAEENAESVGFALNEGKSANANGRSAIVVQDSPPPDLLMAINAMKGDRRSDGGALNRKPVAAGDDVTLTPGWHKAELAASSFWARQLATTKNAWVRLPDFRSRTFAAWLHKRMNQLQTCYVFSREETNNRVTLFFDRLYASRSMSKENEKKARRQLRSAMRRWDRLSEDDLAMTEGKTSRLIVLVKTRYALRIDEAEKQVQQFMDKHPL